MGKIFVCLSDRAEKYVRSKYMRKGDLSKFIEQLVLDEEAREARVVREGRSGGV